MAVDAHAVAAGRIIKADGAGGRGEVARGVLRVDAALDGVLLEFDVTLVELELLAVGDADLLLDQIDARCTSSVTGCSTWMRVFISMK